MTEREDDCSIVAPRHRIVWRLLLTGKTGHGHWFQSWVNLADVVMRLNQAHPDVEYWIESDTPNGDAV